MNEASFLPMHKPCHKGNVHNPTPSENLGQGHVVCTIKRLVLHAGSKSWRKIQFTIGGKA